MLKAFQDLTAVVDSAGICCSPPSPGSLDIQAQIQAACEGDWSEEHLLLVGERIWNIEREFNLAAGFTRKDDNLPPRLMNEPARRVRRKGGVQARHMLPEYYRLRGGPRRGVPPPRRVRVSACDRRQAHEARHHRKRSSGRRGGRDAAEGRSRRGDRAALRRG